MNIASYLIACLGGVFLVGLSVDALAPGKIAANPGWSAAFLIVGMAAAVAVVAAHHKNTKAARRFKQIAQPRPESDQWMEVR